MMQSSAKKIIFTDSGRDIAITGIIESQDDFFIIIRNKYGKTYTIGKKAIICIKDAGCNSDW